MTEKVSNALRAAATALSTSAFEPTATSYIGSSVAGLTTGTVYAFQVRAFGVAGYTDWTDSTTCMCV